MRGGDVPHFVTPDLGPVAAGTVTMLLTTLLMAHVRRHFGVALEFLFVWSVPVGALACGGLAASGYYAGARVTGRRPGHVALACLVVSSVAAGRLFPPAGLEALGLFAQPVALAAWAAFAVGGGTVAALLVHRQHCDHCGRYLPAGVSASMSGSLEDGSRRAEEIRQLLRAGRSDDALALIRALPQSGTEYKITLERRTCQTCRRDHPRLAIRTCVTPQRHARRHR
jgi:hypothetical protein